MARQRSERPRDKMSPWQRGLRPVWLTQDELNELREGANGRTMTLRTYILQLHREKRRTEAQV